MPDQTPEPLTGEQLETLVFDPHRAGVGEVAAMARELHTSRGRIAELEEQRRTVFRAAHAQFSLDLWMALGCPVDEFDGYFQRNHGAGTWANLLGVVRNIFRPKCGKPTDDGPCVLSEHEVGPCHSSGDVGSSEPVPHAEPIEASRPDPDGHAVTVASRDGRWMLTGPALTRDEAAMQARTYADRGARVVEWWEVSE
jgi:hypothetical protein